MFGVGKQERAQSETVGVILLVAVVVLAVSTYGFFYLSTMDDGERGPRLTVHGSTNPPNVTLTHAGGETVGKGELIAVVSVNGKRRGSIPINETFEPGSEFRINASGPPFNASSGDVVSVSVYHPESGRKLYTDSWAKQWEDTATVTPELVSPNATLSAPDTTAVGRPTTLDASGSFDPDGGNASLNYRWDFDGDGSVERTTTTATVTHTYWQAGDYNATVTVVDDEGDTASAAQTITVNATVRMALSPEDGVGETDVDLLGLVDRSPDDALVNFSETTVSSYGGGQDKDGDYQVTDDGRELILRNNTWKRIPYSYEMSSDTVIGVDFRSPEEGDIQGIGLDNDNSQSSRRTYELYGTQDWGTLRYNYTPSAPDWERFRITAGQDYIVNAQYLILLNDDEKNGGDAVSHYRDVMVYEDDTTTYDYAWDVGRDGTTDFTGKQPTRSLAPGSYNVTLTVSYAANGSVVGAVNRTITIDSAEKPPTASFDYSPSSPAIDESVRFDASNSTDPDGGSLNYEWDFGDGSTNATGVSPSHNYDAAGEYTVTLTVTDDEGETNTTTRQVEVEPEFVYALNAGGPERTYDVTYAADQGSNPYQEGSTNTANTGDAIANTTQDGLYQTERYGDFSYDIPVEDGTYRVTVKLAETYWNNNGQRVFDVLLEDDRVVDDIDIHQRVGHDHALDLTFTTAVTDGTLDIDFLTETDNAKLSALRIDKVSTKPQTAEWSTAADWDTATSNSIVHEGSNPGTLRLGTGTTGPGSDSLLVYYPLDGSGDAADATGNGRTATNDGATTGVTGVSGSNAYEFGGNGANIEDADAENYLNGLSNVSVSMWVRSDVANTNNGVFITDQPDGRDNRLGLRYDAGGYINGSRSNLIKYSVSADQSTAEETQSGTQTTAWQHLTLTWTSGGDLKLYIDGTLADPGEAIERASVTGALSNVQSLIVGKGAKDEGNSGWDGKIDEVRIHDRTLTASEAAALHDAASGGELTTAPKTFTNAVDPSSLSLANVSANVPAGTNATVYVESDPDGDGTFDEESAGTTLNGSASEYAIDTSGMSQSDTYRLRIVLGSDDVTATPTVGGVELRSG